MTLQLKIHLYMGIPKSLSTCKKMNEFPIKDPYVYSYSKNITLNRITESYLTDLSIERYFAISKPITYQTAKILFRFSLIYSIPLFIEKYESTLDIENFQLKNGTMNYIQTTPINFIR